MLQPAYEPRPLDVTVLYPCLNEEAAIGACVDSALEAIASAGLQGEVVVVDNASTDRSAEIAAARGARVIHEPRRGYGSAYLRGLQEARGEFVVMLDADGTYPVELVGEFVRNLREGADFVCGNRFAGQMAADAMPFLNRYVGNPVLSGMTRALFSVGLKDMHCGMRAIRRASVPELRLQTLGMEFATEMIVKALDGDLRVRELPIAYRPRIGESKLVPFRDGWRHVEYMLVFSPGLVFILPGLALAAAGLATQLALLTPQEILFRTWDVHTNVAGLALVLTGSTLAILGVVGAHYAWTSGMRFRHSGLARRVAEAGDRPLRWLGSALALTGAALWLGTIGQWAASGFGPLSALPVLTLATSLLAPGLELLGASMLVHLVRIPRAGG